MSAEQFEQLARQAEQLAREVEQVNTHLRRIGESAMSVIGGTTTGADKAMLGLTQQAAAKTRAAMTNFAEAARTARTAATTERELERRDTRKTR